MNRPFLVGMDEVGRGAWAGPLLVAAVVLRPDDFIGLKDSKQLSRAKRQTLYYQICKRAHGVQLCWQPNSQIDEIGLGSTLKTAFTACFEPFKQLNATFVVDGSFNYLDHPQSLAKPKADESVPAVAAASIVAKHLRDSYMMYLANHDSRYGFEKHVGYGTQYHRDKLAEHGPGKFHRLSFKGVQ